MIEETVLGEFSAEAVAGGIEFKRRVEAGSTSRSARVAVARWGRPAQVTARVEIVPGPAISEITT